MITIITPAYNVIDSITKTYASVMSQKNVEFEYIIVDGMSIDNSIELYYISCFTSYDCIKSD